MIFIFSLIKILNEASGQYDDKIIEKYSNKLILEFGKNITKEPSIE